MAGIVDSTGIYTPNEIIVDATAGNTPFQTIAEAITAASIMGSPTTIYVRPGTYTEDLTLVDGINIVGENRYDTIIDGEHTVPASGQIRFKDIKLAQSTPGSDIFVESGAGTCAIDVESCIFNVDSGLIFNLINSTGPIGVYNCLDISAGSRLINNGTGASALTVRDSQVGSSTIFPISFNGTTTIYNSHIGCRVIVSNAVTLTAYDSVFDEAVEGSSGGCSINLYRCTLNGAVFGSGRLDLWNCSILNSINIVSTGTAYLHSCSIDSTTGSDLEDTASIYCYNCDIHTPGAISFTLIDTTKLYLYDSYLNSTTVSTISTLLGVEVYANNVTIDSTVGTGEAITGTGVLYYENLTFSNTATNIAAGVTQEATGLIRANNISLPEADATGSEGIVHFSDDVSLFTRGDSIFLGAENLSGNSLIGLGFNALELNATGTSCVAVGNGACRQSTGAVNCVCVGNNTGNYMANNSQANTIIGSQTGTGTAARLIGSYHTVVGTAALVNQTGSYCTAIGYKSLQENISGAGNGYNTALGYQSGQNLISGTYNLLLSHNAGSAYVGAESSNIILMNSGTAAESNVIRIGTQGTGNGQQDTCYIAGIAGSSVSNQQAVVIDSTTGQLGVNATLPVGSIEVTSDTTFTNNATHWNNKPAARLSMALPATAATGTTIRLVGYAANGWTITQGAGQQIHDDAANSTTAGAAGSITSNDRYDTIELLCVVADTTWVVVNVKSNPTIA